MSQCTVFRARYRVTVGLEHAVIDADDARFDWDTAPEEHRSGSRDGAFILWQTDEIGRRTLPVLYKPLQDAA